MHKFVTWSFYFSFIAAGLASAQTAPALDHFRCYFIQGALVQQFVTLQDQFDLAGNVVENVTDLRMTFLCNPVQKTLANGATTPIAHPADHLLWYLINPQPTVPRVVSVKNQFGRQDLAVRNGFVLAVPTGTSAPSTIPFVPTDLDHFKCYSAAGKSIGKIVTLKDEFHTETVRVLEPIAFCNPVQKTHPPTVTTIQNPAGHLTCYVTTRSPLQGTPVTINNQFGVGAVVPLQGEILCVPSAKLSWAEVPAVTAADINKGNEDEHGNDNGDDNDQGDNGEGHGKGKGK